MTDESAIQEDVLDADAEDAAEVQAAEQQERPTSLTPREQRMRDLIAKRDGSLGVGEAVTHPDLQAKAPEQEQQVDAATQQGADKTDAPGEREPAKSNAYAELEKVIGLKFEQGDDGKPYTTLKINGQMVKVPADRVAQQLQKELAGDVKLNEANRLMQQAQQLLQQREMQRSTTTQPPAQGADWKQEAKQFLDQLYDGESTDVAAEKLADLLNKASAPRQAPDPQSLMPQLTSAVESVFAQREYSKDLQEGLTLFSENYSHLAGDEYLADMVDRETLRIERENPALTPKQIIEAAAKKVDAWLQARGGNAHQSRADADSRAERKRNLQPIPAAASQRYAPPKKPVVDSSPAAVLDRMKAQRGAFRGIPAR